SERQSSLAELRQGTLQPVGADKEAERIARLGFAALGHARFIPADHPVGSLAQRLEPRIDLDQASARNARRSASFRSTVVARGRSMRPFRRNLLSVRLTVSMVRPR